MSSNTFQTILNATNLDSLETGASDVAQKNFRLVHELYDSDGRSLTFREFVTEILANHSHWFYHEGGMVAGNRALMLRHPYGVRWSRFLKSYIVSAYGASSKNKINIEVEDQFIRIDFS